MWKRHVIRATVSGMDDTESIDQHDVRRWAEALRRSEAEAAAGQAVSGEAMRNRLRASIARMESKLEPRASRP
jgi:hypothetical protein